MKKIISAVAIIMIAFVGINTSMAHNVVKSGPSVTINGVNPMMGRVNNIHLIDGVPAVVSWSMNNAPTGTVAQVWIMGLINGQESWGYSLAANDRNPVTGRITWLPRVVQGVPNQYKVKVTWKIVLVGTEVATAERQVFTVTCHSDRVIELFQPTSNAQINGQALISFTWASIGLPADAKIQLTAQPSWNSEAGGIIITTTSNTGGYMMWVGDLQTPPTPGQYIVTAYWVTENGVFGAASNGVLLNLPNP